jgi:hypothetical protein
MKGSGRRFEEAGFLDKLSRIHGYIVCDIEGFPNIPYWLVSRDTVKAWWIARRLGTTSQVSRSRANLLLTECETIAF